MIHEFLLKHSETSIEIFTHLARKNFFFGTLYKSFFQSKVFDKNYPYIVNIEVTNACNLNCRMCPRKKSKRKIGFMDFNLFKKIVDESSRYGPRIFTLHKDGEPLLHPKIIEMIRYIKNKNKKNSIYLTTNGHFLDKNKIKAIISLGVDKLNISIGADKKETYFLVRGSLDLEKVEENVKKAIFLKKLMKAKRPQIVVQIIRMEETLKEVNSFIKKWKKIGAKVSIWNFLNWGGEKKDKTIKEFGKRYPCYALWMAPVINWDGQVSICCIDWNCSEIIGNIYKNSFHEIWKSKNLKDYRKIHLKGQYKKIKLCEKCNSWHDYPDFLFQWQKNEKR